MAWCARSRNLLPTTRAAAAALAAVLAGCATPEPRMPTPDAAVEPDIPIQEQVADAIRGRVEAAAQPAARLAGNDLLHTLDALAGFYSGRAYAPTWSRDGQVGAEADSLLAVVAEAASHGLAPSDYHDAAARELLDAVRAAAASDPRQGSRLADLDFLLTDAFVLLASDLRVGRVNPETIDPEWNTARPGNEPLETLDAALRTRDVASALRDQAPQHEAYRALRGALARYRDAEASAWPPVGSGPMLKRGHRDARVPAVRGRLVWTGNADSTLLAADDSTSFDDAVDTALRSFQRAHGLPADGVLGPATVAELDTPPAARVRQIEANLERWRWLPRDFGARYLVINIAGFELDAIENGRSVLRMRVVAGRDYRRTPVFSGTMTYLVFSPYWNVPPLLAKEDELPAILEDPGILERTGMRVLEGWGADEREIDPATVDWSAVTPKNLRYHFRQDPGPTNALGGVKFMFPNRFDVYLHDTPATGLFARMPRDFSSGCIRLERPAALAEYVLDDAKSWDAEHVKEAMRAGKERTVRLRRPIPIHILYWTAFVEADGRLQFRRDVYSRDAPLLEALHRTPGA